MAAELKIGDWFDGHYLIVGALGAGGFANVYAATDRESGESVAIKVLKPGTAGYDKTTLMRFEREAEALKRLTSDGISRLIRHGHTADAVPYLVFELVRGEDLSELLERRGKLEADETVVVLRQLATVLGDAHEVGVLHRDLKPENVRVTDPRSLRVKLLDFGIARLTDEGSPSLTATGELIGTPYYMSPEQLTGRPLTPASDIYSLGVLAFELLLGRNAMHGRSFSSQIDRMHGGYQFPEADIGGYGDGLLGILRRMTTREAQARYQSAHAVLVALDSLDRDPTIGAAHISAPTPPIPEVPRVRRKWPSVVALALAAVGIVVVASTVPNNPVPERAAPPKPTPALNPNAPAQVRAVPADEAPPTITTDARSSDDPCTIAPWFTGYGELFDHAAYIPPVPPGERLPLVIMLHGNGMDPVGWLRASGFPSLAKKHRFVVVAPDGGMINSWDGDRTNDLKRLELLQELAQEELCIDSRRIFVVGQEQAGGITYDLSCEPWVSAIALNAYSLTRSDEFCDGGSTPMPTMLSFPDSFGWTPPDGGLNCKGKTHRLSFDEQEEMWRKRNGCTKELETSTPEAAVCNDWRCAQPLRVCRTRGGGDWPGAAPSMRLNAGECKSAPTSFRHAEQMWDFFRGVPLPDSDNGSD